MKICAKKGCNEIGQYRCGKYSLYCVKHYRFCHMRSKAKRYKKFCPTWDTLEKLIPYNMICPTCDKDMIWHTSLGVRKDVISLQHNHNGNIILICHSCNVSHGNSKLGDNYFNIPKNHKYCPKCDKILNKIKFHKNKYIKNNLNGICKDCDNKKNQKKRNDRKNNNLCSDCKNILSIHSIYYCEKHLIQRRESSKKRGKNK